MISDALDINLVSRTVGYKLSKGNFNTSSPNLPQLIAIFGEANLANQSTLDPTTPMQITSAAQAGALYGYGSPIYLSARILFPVNGGGTSTPVMVYPQAVAAGATSKKLVVTPTGTATANGVHTLVLNGRQGLDGLFYNINVVVGDTPAIISQKIADATNAILGAPATGTLLTTTCVLESKWQGLTADSMNASMFTNGISLGITYAVTSSQAGAATPSVAASLALIGSNWVTKIINCYGTESTSCTAFEGWNGRPDPVTPTGRFATIAMKPAVVLVGSVADNEATFTDARLNEQTIAICPAPLSLGFAFEAAANYMVRESNTSSNTPHLHIAGQSLPDMPVPANKNIGTMAIYANRQAYVLKGCSTVDLVSGVYLIDDFVTTYHKLGETPPQYRYVRDLNVDFNVFYSYRLLENIYVIDHVICQDADIVSATNVIKPKQWKAVLSSALYPDLINRGLITQLAFSVSSTYVGIGTTNPNRFETSFSYKRTGAALVVSTTVFAGFNFGS